MEDPLNLSTQGSHKESLRAAIKPRSYWALNHHNTVVTLL